MIRLPRRPTQSFFLWGPRQTGKSTLLRQLYPDAYWIDLLDTDALLRFTQRPALLREEVADRPPRQVTADRIEILPYATFAARLWAGELLR